MSKYLFFVCTVGVAVSLFGGCCIDRVYQPSQCNDNWDSVLGSCTQCGSCGGSCEGHTPCQAVKHSLTCGAGCGEIYWGEWTSDPPDECDPCDNCGNWVGPTCCSPAWWERFKSGLSGWRNGSDACSCGNGTGYEEEYVGDTFQDDMIDDGTPIHGNGMIHGNGIIHEGTPTPGRAPPMNGESIQTQPRPAVRAEPMPENQTRHRAAPQRTAPKLLASPQSQPPRHPMSVLAKSHNSTKSRGPAATKAGNRSAPAPVKQATRYE